MSRFLLAAGMAATALVVLSGADPAGASAHEPTGIDVGPILATTTSTAPPGGPVDGDEAEGKPGFFDVGGRIKKAINDWFRDLVTSALDPVFDLLGRTVLATPLVTGPGRVRDLWAGSAGVANVVMVLLGVVGGAVAMSHETLQTRYSIKEVAPRLVVAVVAVNASLGLAGQAIRLANALSVALLGGHHRADEASVGIKTIVLGAVSGGGILVVLIGGVAVAFALSVLVVYVVRCALVVILIAAAPLALACHALPQSEGIARTWWRALFAVLAVQVGQALVFVTAVRVFFATDGHAALGLPAGGAVVDLLVTICLFWVLVRIPVWAGRAVFSDRRAFHVIHTVKHVVVAQATRAAVVGG
jgi:hypothetical protein